MCFRKSILAPLCLVLLVSACSVKEDRHNCPCILTVDLGNLRGGNLQEMNTAEISYDCGTAGCYLPGEIPPEAEVAVPRSGVFLAFHSLSSGWGKVSPGNSLIIPVGQECPDIYSYTKALVTDCETVRDTVEMHKNFARLRIRAPAFEGIADSLCVTSDVKGYSLKGEPLNGPFSCSRVPDRDNSITVAVPRQTGPSLKLLVLVGNQTFRTFAIGWAIVASGYDWSMTDLADMDIEVDYAVTRISYSTDPWSDTQTFTIVI